MVTLAELKTHLRIEHDEEDTYLAMLLSVAEAAVLDFCKTKPDGRSKVPEPMRLAVLLHASHFYTNRENGSLDAYRGMMQAFESLLWPHRDAGKLV